MAGARAAGSDRDNRISSTYTTLRELIVLGRLAPGSRVIEAEIAERLDVSRTPVRSALHRLQQEGYIIEVEGGRRARLIVAPLTRGDATELFYLNGQLEGLAGYNAALLAPQARIAVADSMRQVNDDLAVLAAKKQPDPHRFHDLDVDFHEAYIDAAAGPRLRASYDSLKPQVDRYNRVYALAMTAVFDASVAEHRRIVKELAAGNAAATQEAIQRNWRNAAARLTELIDTVGERGSW